MNEKLRAAQELHRVLQQFVQTLTDESEMMEVADMFPAYVVGKHYKQGDKFKYGKNADDETQLYQVLQEHTSKEGWEPNTAVSLYKKIGYDPGGIPIWTQPLGAADAYQTGDVVSHNGSIWTSTVDNNVWEPGVYGWDLNE